VNEIIVLFTDAATFSDAQRVADFVSGTITGFISLPQIYKIEVQTDMITELDSLITNLNEVGDSSVQAVTRNFILEAL